MRGILAALTYLRGSATRWRRSTPCRGNVDHGAWSAKLPVTHRIEIDGFHIYVLHILAELDPQAAVTRAFRKSYLDGGEQRAEPPRHRRLE
jgi:hypothetical protein